MNGRNNRIQFKTLNNFINEHKTKFFHHTHRLCSCGKLPGCNFCRGMGYYFIKGKPFVGILSNPQMNHTHPVKEAFARQESIVYGNPENENESFDIWTNSRHVTFDKNDLVIPLQAKWHITNELVRVNSSRLTLYPSKIEGPITFTDEKYGEITEYLQGRDFTFKERDIVFNTPPPTWAKRFSVRYWAMPEFLVWEHPQTSTEKGETIWKNIIVKKRTLPPADQEIGRGVEDDAFTNIDELENFPN